MFRVRYYDQFFHPNHFNKGIRGWWIRVLNWWRWKLEVYIQRHVVKYLAAETDAPKKSQYIKMFELDVKNEKLQMELTSPEVVRLQSELENTDLRGNVSSKPSEVQPPRPLPIDDMARRYMVNKRRQRYAWGRDKRLINSEDGIEIILKE